MIAGVAAMLMGVLGLPPALDVPLPEDPFEPVPPVEEAEFTPRIACAGVDELLRGPDLGSRGGPLLVEEYCSSSYAFTDELGQEEAADALMNSGASWLLALSATIVRITTVALQWAFSPDFVAGLSVRVDQIVGLIRGVLFEPFVLVGITLGGVWGLWHGVIRRRATLTAEGWVWVLCALVFASWFLARPASIAEGANAASAMVGRTVLGLVQQVDPHAHAAGGAGAVDETLRVTADRLHRMLVHQPWQLGQFGDAATGDQHGMAYLQATTITAGEMDAVRGDPEAVEALIEAKEEARTNLVEQIATGHPEVGGWFSGRQPLQRLGVSGLSLLAAVGTAAGVLTLAATVVALQLATFLLVLMSPVFCAIGIHPGAGRRVALRWLELLLGTVLKRVVLTTALAILVVAYGLLLEAAAGGGWLLGVLLTVLFGLAAVAGWRSLGNVVGRLIPDGIAGRAGREAPS